MLDEATALKNELIDLLKLGAFEQVSLKLSRYTQGRKESRQRTNHYPGRHRIEHIRRSMEPN